MNVDGCTLVLDRVTKRFGDFTAVNELSLSARAGRIFGLLGPNGAGKTTTIRMIVNINAPDSGRVELFGQQISPQLQDRIGYLPEERGLYKHMKVLDQLRFFGKLKNFQGQQADEAIARWLAKLQLTEWKNRKALELSKGMQQKIQFIATVAHDPELLILDEPFSGLDPVNVELLKEIVLELKEAGKTILFSTHLMEMAEKICDDICLINRSQKVLDGSLREIKRSFGRHAVALRFQGDDSVLKDHSLVTNVKAVSDGMEVTLAPGASGQDLLQRLLASGTSITKFELIEPSLHDIFIKKVRDS